MYLWYYRGKFGGCRQIPTQKNVWGSKLCWHDRGISAKCADIWLSGQHVADMLATFSAKMARATAMNLTAMERLMAMVTAMEGSMVTEKVMAIECLTAM
jgi:hypothetical protein